MNKRLTALAAILKLHPGNDGATQRARILVAMQTLSHVTSYEASRYLDCYDPRARVHELRRKHGYVITTVMRAQQTESGEAHSVGVYFLSQSKEAGTC